MNSLARFIIPLVLVWSAPSAQANSPSCDLSLDLSDATLNWDFNFSFKALNLTVSKNSKKACNFSITMSRGGSGNFDRVMEGPGSKLPYQLYKNSGLTEIIKDGGDVVSSANFIYGQLPEGATSITLTYYIAIPLNGATQPTLKPSGNYHDVVIAKLYESEKPSGNPSSVRSLKVNTNIPRLLDISLVDCGGGFDPGQTTKTLRFGDLKEGAQQGVDLLVRTNVGYSITLSSLSNGVLSRVGGGSKVPYQVEIFGKRISLNQPATIVGVGNQPSGPSGVRHPIMVVVGNTSEGLAGQYQDSITVTATAN